MYFLLIDKLARLIQLPDGHIEKSIMPHWATEEILKRFDNGIFNTEDALSKIFRLSDE